MIDDTLPKQAVLVVNAMSRNGSDAFERARFALAQGFSNAEPAARYRS